MLIPRVLYVRKLALRVLATILSGLLKAIGFLRNYAIETSRPPPQKKNMCQIKKGVGVEEFAYKSSTGVVSYPL